MVQVEVPARRSIFSDSSRRKVPITRFPCVQNCPWQDSCALKTFLCSLCVQKHLCPDRRAFKIVYDQTFVCSHANFVRSKFEKLSIHVQTIVRSKTPKSKFSCVQNFSRGLHAFKNLYIQISVRVCPDLSSFLFI